MRFWPCVGIVVLTGCGPALAEPNAVHVRVVVAPPQPPEPMVIPTYVVAPPPPPPLVAPIDYADTIHTPVHLYMADAPPPPAPMPPPPVLECPAAVSALAGQPVTLTASGRGVALNYTWHMVEDSQSTPYRFASQFDNTSPVRATAEGPSVPFVTPIIGSYTLEAEVVDSYGRMARCDTLVTVHGHGLRVQLSWNTNNTDVDLHMVTTTDPRWVSNSDCYYANRRPATDPQDPAQARWLDTDDVDGEGPENIRVDQPDGQRGYMIGVHYYSSHGQPDPTTAIVVVYCGDQRVARFEHNLVGGRGVEQNDFWQVAVVHTLPGDACTVQPIGVVTSQAAVASRQ